LKAAAGHPLHLVLGLTLWFVWFCAVYGGAAVACAVAPPPAALGAATWVNASVLLLTGVTTVALASGAWRMGQAARGVPSSPRPDRQRFLATVSAALYATAAASTVLVGLPAAWLPPCL
jgi:hypothetical protein